MKSTTESRITRAALVILALLTQACSNGFNIAESTALNSTDEKGLFDPSAKGNPFVCQNAFQPSTTPVTRLTRTQYSNTLQNALGKPVYDQILPVISTLYDDILTNNVFDFRPRIEETQMSAYQSIAEKAYTSITGTPSLAVGLATSCVSSQVLTAACKDNFIKSLGQKMFRRPLADTEINKYRSQVFDSGENGTEGVALTVYTMMLSPDFLLRLELGSEDDATTTAVYNISQYQVASRLSYLLWDAPPDDTLMQAAAANKLLTPYHLSVQVDRMITDPRAKAKIRDFFKFWLDPKKYSAGSFSSDFLAGLDVYNVNNEFEREMYEYIDYVLYEKKGSFQDLLAGTESFARTPAAAQIYGHAAVTGKEPAQLHGQRKGLLMRAPVIATEGNETHPILRGVKFKRRFMCDDLGLPSGVMTNDPTFFSDEARLHDSTRTRTAGLTASTSCMACHSSINPYGFALENFDGLGRVRDKEVSYSTLGKRLAEFPVDTRVQNIVVESGSSYDANDGTEVIDHMLAGNKVPACFIQQIYRYYSLKSEAPADGCQLNSMYNKIKSEDYSSKPLLSVFKELFIYPSVLKRSLK